MSRYEIKIKLKSPALIGSGEGYGGIIDSDTVFDDLGLPFIPARRVKGCLRDSIVQVQNMFELAEINYKNLKENIVQTFGSCGGTAGKVVFSNLFIQEYPESRAWIKYLSGKYEDVFNRNSIIDCLSEIRHQTSINDAGVAKNNSLRAIRVVKKGTEFYGPLDLPDEKEIVDTLILACLNLKHIGTKRNRGFGAIECRLLKNGKEQEIPEEVKALCTA